jgi:2-methoxy-6-polyprenyl-1,4-benzoquinol methylase
MGQIVAGDRDAYQCLVESIEKFPKRDDFAMMIQDAGFHLPSKDGEEAFENLTGGVVAVHRGIKL